MKIFHLQVRESLAPLNIPTPTTATDERPMGVRSYSEGLGDGRAQCSGLVGSGAANKWPKILAVWSVPLTNELQEKTANAKHMAAAHDARHRPYKRVQPHFLPTGN